MERGLILRNVCARPQLCCVRETLREAFEGGFVARTTSPATGAPDSMRSSACVIKG